MTYGESAQESAMHDPDSEEETHAQMARARTRGSVPHLGRGRQSEPGTTTESVRSALDEARQRWTHSVPETAQDNPGPDAQQDPAETRTVPAAPPRPESPVRPPSPQHPMPFSWSDWSRPLRDTWRTYCNGAARVGEFMPIAVPGYWLLAAPAFVIHIILRIGQDSTTSLTRTFVFVVVVVILIAGIATAL